MNICPTIRPLPYYTVSGAIDYTALAHSLRMEFTPKVARRLPGHHLRGFRHDTIVHFVKKNKKRYPCFLKTDITKFYPSVRHRDMIVGLQIAYRDLLGLDYVPKAFKKRYVSAVNAWCKSLPLNEGIPLGSPLSAILAPLMLVPLWLELKRQFNVPFLVYMDDLLVMCEDEQQCTEIYAFIFNRLKLEYGLSLNLNKTVSGRFSRKNVCFCGWSFAGGYAAISDEKLTAFKDRVAAEIRACKGLDTSRFLKRLNRKIDGFGHYYKYGDVSRQFALLDAFLRHEVRLWLKQESKRTSLSNEQLYALGLHTLQGCYTKIRIVKEKRKQPPAIVSRAAKQDNECRDMMWLKDLQENVAKISRQLTQLVSLHRHQVRMMEHIYP